MDWEMKSQDSEIRREINVIRNKQKTDFDEVVGDMESLDRKVTHEL